MRKILLFIFLLSSFSLTAQMQMRLRGSHNPVLTPQQVDSLFYWFDANNLSSLQDSVGGAIATNEGVATWYDMSGRGYHVTQTTNTARPVYKATGGPGSKPCLQFDGDDALFSSNHYWGSDDVTIFVVGKNNSATTNAQEYLVARWTTAANNRQWRLSFEAAAASYVLRLYKSSDGTSAAAVSLENASVVKSATYRIVSCIKNGTGGTFYLNGSSYSGGAYANATVHNETKPVYIGQILQGSISEVIVYSRALTADERVGIEEYLQAKWGL